ncbi:MAG: ribonuclease H family protein [Muribaculaceae bacterium]|nr:ribonuclease H family protein [Muribaculaceae bacterium]
MGEYRKKFYVVWVGYSPGIYDSWEEAKLQIDGFPGARFKAFPTQEMATRAFRGDPDEQKSMLRAIASHRADSLATFNIDEHPDVIRDSICVDGACSKNPGPIEYRCVDTATGAEIFRVGPLEGGTNNIAEYLALIHALALLNKNGNDHTVIYSDSRTAQSWIRNRGNKSTLKPTQQNAKIRELLARADAWIQSHPYHSRILKWDTDRWGEIPADFNRK